MKAQKMFRALATVLFAALLVTGCGGGDSYETFSLAMDEMFGEEGWSDKSHSTSLFGGTLTVEGVAVKGAGSGEEGPALEIATVELKKLLAKEELQSILEAKDWKDRKETTLAGAVVLKGLKFSGGNLDELNLEGLSLAAAEANALEGPAGFLKAARMGKAVFTNFKAADDAGTEMSLARINADKLSFDADPLPGLEALDPSGLASVASSFSAQNFSFKDLAMTVTSLSEDGQPAGKVNLSLAALDQKGLKGFRAASSWAMTGLKFNTEDDEDMKLDFSLDSMIFNEVDMTEYVSKITPAIILASLGGSDINEAVNGLQTFADFFVTPMSLKDASVKGLDFKVNDMIGIKMADSKVVGPWTAGTIAPKQTSTIAGLEVVLPESAEGLTGEALNLYQFARDFGMSRFVMDLAGESTYDPATGRVTSNQVKITAKELGELNFDMGLAGLTQERLETLKGVSLNDAFMVLMDPGAVFGDISLENLELTYTDLGLVGRIYAYTGKTELGGASADQVKSMAAGAVALGLAAQGGLYLEKPEALAASLQAFLNDPKVLKVTAKPAPPLSFVSAQTFQGDTNKILNSLALTVSANNEEGVSPLVFNIPLGPADLSQMSDEELEEYLEDELEDEAVEE